MDSVQIQIAIINLKKVTYHTLSITGIQYYLWQSHKINICKFYLVAIIEMSQEWIHESDGSEFVPDSQDSSCSIPYNSHSQKPYQPVVSEGI